ncbi:MAG: hypothetical protein OTJ45_02330, partial [Alphaproteobacteria bacterium]|nr:hypothetical protein [Alphaproteobacteria bacterium]
IVPTLQCGFVRSNFSFDIILPCVLSIVAPAKHRYSGWRLGRPPSHSVRSSAGALERVKGIEPSS